MWGEEWGGCSESKTLNLYHSFLLTLFPCSSTGLLRGWQSSGKNLLQCGFSRGHSSFRKWSSALACGPPWVAVWICSLPWSCCCSSSSGLGISSVVSHFLFPFPLSLGCFLLLNTFSENCHTHGGWAQLCPAAGSVLELARITCV